MLDIGNVEHSDILPHTVAEHYGNERRKTKLGESVKFSLSDSTGRQLTKEQAKYFKDSKARDENGSLLTLFHQTDNDFTIFDTRHDGRGTGDSETPFGIFLKPTSSDIGIKGDKQMELYADIRNPLVAKDRVELKRLLSESRLL